MKIASSFAQGKRDILLLFKVSKLLTVNNIELKARVKKTVFFPFHGSINFIAFKTKRRAVSP